VAAHLTPHQAGISPAAFLTHAGAAADT
jgi:hypothetical protein